MGLYYHRAVIGVLYSEQSSWVESFRSAIPEEIQPLLVGPIKGWNDYDFWFFSPDGRKVNGDYADEVQKYRVAFVRLLGKLHTDDSVALSFGTEAGDIPIAEHVIDLTDPDPRARRRLPEFQPKEQE